MKENLKRWLPLLVLLVFLATIFVPRGVEKRTCMAFGQPLFDHVLPEKAEIISTDAAKDDDGGVTAAILLKTDLTSQELEEFYADLECPPAEEGQNVTLQAKALTEADLAVLQQAKLYEEGASYQFIYVYSK